MVSESAHRSRAEDIVETNVWKCMFRFSPIPAMPLRAGAHFLGTAPAPAGDYNAKIGQRIARIKSTCSVQ